MFFVFRTALNLSILYRTTQYGVTARTFAMQSIYNKLAGKSEYSQSDVPDMQGRVSLFAVNRNSPDLK